MRVYRVVDHTADVGIVVKGRDLNSLFANAGFAFFDLTWDLAGVEERLSYPMHIEEDGLTELLVGFLRELLYLNQAEGYIFKRFEVNQLDGSSLEITGLGEKLDPNRHQGKMEVKGVTYHQAAVSREGDTYQATVIFDI
ncbi:MAG: archease [Thermodesulfobacteriota bacterium]